MSLLAKKFSIKNLLKPGLMMLIPVFFGCETQSDLGIKYDLGSEAGVKFVEFTLPATNIYIDSLKTDGEGQILVGKYSDSLTGSVSAEGYFNYSYESGPLPRAKSSSSNQNPVDTLKLDSLVLVIKVGSLIPSLPTEQSFEVFQLKNNLDNNLVYLSNNKQDLDLKIGEFSTTISPKDDSVYRIKLDSSYAKSFFFQISNIAGDVGQSIDSYLFKPLGLIPNNDSKTISSVDLSSDTLRIFLYSSPISQESKDTTYITSFEPIGKNYSHIDRNLSESEFSGISEKQNFDLPSGKTIIDPLMGLSTAFSLAPLKDFFDQNENILINNASLALKFEADENRDTLEIFLNYFRKSDNSFFGSAIQANPFGNIVMSDNGYLNLNSNPAASSFNNEKNELLLSSTLFYQQLYRQYIDSLIFINPTNGSVRPVEYLVLISPIDVTLQRTIFKKDGIKLRLYYTEVDQ
uniref:hypothetical protein n=1 Tax=Ekhidna sp. TaxID=2608089 RepID=UPI0032ED27DC